MPPVADTVCEYTTPTVPPGKLAGFTTIAALTVKVYDREPVAPLPSAAVIVKLLVAAALGVPEITPLAPFNARPAGNAPDVTLYV